MRDYGKVHSTFWTSPTTSVMGDRAKVLALYLMTCSHSTIAGVFRLPDGYIAEDLRWTTETVAEAFDELYRKGFATRCNETKWVWVTKHLEWNPPENPNQRKAALKVACGVPSECCWKLGFIRDFGESLGMPNDPNAKPFVNPYVTVLKPGTVTGAVSGTEAGAGVDAAAAAAQKAADAASAGETSTHGTRLPKEWLLPKAWGDWALAEFPAWNDGTVRLEAEKFRDYWVPKTGKDATKLEWQATWRNWCRNARVTGKPGAVGTDRDAVNAENTAEAARLYQASRAGGEVIDAETRIVGDQPQLQGEQE